MLCLHKTKTFRKCLRTWAETYKSLGKNKVQCFGYRVLFHICKKNQTMVYKKFIEMWRSGWSFRCESHAWIHLVVYITTLCRDSTIRVYFYHWKNIQILWKEEKESFCVVSLHRGSQKWLEPPALWPSLYFVSVLSCAGPCGKDSVSKVALLGAGKTLKRYTLVWGHWACTFKGSAGCFGSSFMSLASLVHLVLKTWSDTAQQAWTEPPRLWAQIICKDGKLSLGICCSSRNLSITALKWTLKILLFIRHMPCVPSWESRVP